MTIAAHSLWNSMEADTLGADSLLATMKIRRDFLEAQQRARNWDLIVCPPPPLNRGAVKK